MNRTKKPYFVQAPIKPVDADGISIGIIGTICFAIGTIYLLCNIDQLKADNQVWYLGTALAGLLIGIVFTTSGYLRSQRRKHQNK